MGHIFISYSHTDTTYAHRLADALQGMGFETWIDARLDYGSHWPLEIQKQLDACEAFIVIMSPRAFTSEWVQSELQRAKRKQKAIFPLLLEGDEPWLSVESTQFYDVRGEKLPDTKFFEALKKVISVSPGARTLQSPKGVGQFPESQPIAAPRPSQMRIITVFAGLIALVVACSFCAIGTGWFAFRNFPNFVGGPSPVASPLPAATAQGAKDVPPTSISSQNPTATLPPNPTELSIRSPEMILIPAGEFSMGSTKGDPDEKPVHKVYLDAFLIDKFEVTNAQYKACADAGVCKPPDGIRLLDFTNPDVANFPVARIDWNMAKAFCEWRGARLPSEAEWEKAARGNDERTYPWGENISCELANYQDCGSSPQAVGSHPQGASPYGLQDMAGNVWEWVADYYTDTYYAKSPAKNPTGPQAGTLRVIRGGSWGYDPSFLRTTIRYGFEPASLENDLGFRCAKSSQP